MNNTQRGDVLLIPIFLAEEVRAGDSLIELLWKAVGQTELVLQEGDVLVVKHKIVSKAEGRIVPLAKVRTSPASRHWAEKYGLDARVTEVALSQSNRIVRRKNGVMITETEHGFVCANSGVDVSNVDGGQHALLLPKNPDLSAQRLHLGLKKKTQLSIPVIITDSFGRPWREGLTEAAIGVAGIKALRDYRGQLDPHGYPLRVSLEAVADELACAAGLVCGKLERTPACIIRGFKYQPGRGTARDLVRSAATDLFR